MSHPLAGHPLAPRPLILLSPPPDLPRPPLTKNRQVETSSDSEADYDELPPYKQVQCDQYEEFHEDFQKEFGEQGSMRRLIWGIVNDIHPGMPEDDAKEEMKTAEAEEGEVTIVDVVLPDGTTRKRITPIFVKTEPDREHTQFYQPKEADTLPFYDEQLAHDLIRGPDDSPFESFDEAATDSSVYLSDDEVISVESDSSEAEEFEEKPVVKIEPDAVDACLNQISSGLKAAAEGYDILRNHLKTMTPYEAADVARHIPAPPSASLPPVITTVMDKIGAEETVNHLIVGLYQHPKYNTYNKVQAVTDLKRDRVQEAITGKKRVGGSQLRSGTGKKP